MKEGIVIPEEVERKAEEFASGYRKALDEHRKKVLKEKNGVSLYDLLMTAYSGRKKNSSLDRGISRVRTRREK